MHEVFPVVAGVLVGLITMRIANMRLRTLAFVVLSVIFGITATTISGEFAISWEFLLVDIPLVMVAAIATVVVATRAPRWVAARR
jgi:thiamine transporter ThiT